MKKLLLLMIAAVAAMSLCAAPVDQAAATKVAKKFLTEKMYAGKIMAPAALNPVLLKAEIGKVKLTEPVYYIFNTSTTFLVVAGDDRAEAILMVGDEPLKDINNLPPSMKSLLGQYMDEIMFLQEHPGLQVQPIVGSQMHSPMFSGSDSGGTYLLDAKWDQEAPYYNQCVFSYGNRSYQCLTGCPATSASMVFYYWKYPIEETGIIPGYRMTLNESYYVNVDPLPSVTFDWNNMKNTYSTSASGSSATAVATLMRYVGQAEHMDYGTASYGSGVESDSVSLIRDAFLRLGYDPTTVRFVKKTSSYYSSTQLYTDAEWAAMIQEEMAASRPIVFCAISSQGGHAFNVDGYNSSTNKYHCNFGWSGSGNGWCALNSFASSSGYTSGTFNQYQQMVIGIQPPDGNLPALSVDPTSLTFTATTGATLTKTFTVIGTDLKGDVTVTCSGNSYYTVSPTTISKAEAEAGATVTVTYKPTVSGTHTGTVTIASSYADSKTVSLSGTASKIPTITVDPESLTLTTLVDQPVTQTFRLKGENLTNNVLIDVEDEYDVFSADKISVSRTAANNGVDVTVTFNPYEIGTFSGNIVLTSTGAETVRVPLTGIVTIETFAPVMTPAVEQYINLTEFRADWTDATSAENVLSYTLEVQAKAVEPEPDPDPVLLHSLTGSAYTGNYVDITLSAPWEGVSVRGGNNAIYIKNNYNNVAQGYITYTIPQGYTNATFTVMITSSNTTYGTGNVTVYSPQTAEEGYNFSRNQTHKWLVTASSGEKITIYTTDANYSPDMSLIAVYSGDATTTNLNASETGNATYRLIEGITDKYYTVKNLTAEGTFLYKVKALYVNGTESEWSNIEEVTLFQNGHGYDLGDVNHDGLVSIVDITILIDYVLNGGECCTTCADVDESGDVSIVDVTSLIDLVLNQ